MGQTGAMDQPTSVLGGIHVPLVTPFADDGAVALDALRRLAHTVLDQGAAGIVALGTTAEAATLDADERLAIIDLCAEVCRERDAALTVGVGGNDTRGAVEGLSRLARWPRTAAALVPVPYYTRPGEAGVIAHFTRLEADSPVPLLVYHIPYRTSQPLRAAALRTLGQLPGIVGVKYATGGVDQDAVELLGDLPTDFAVLAGDDIYLSPLLALGGHGGILASAHLATARFVELARAWRDGDVVRARPLGHALARLSAAAFAEPNPTVIKGVLREQGLIPTAKVRLPLLAAQPDSVSEVLRRLADLGG